MKLNLSKMTKKSKYSSDQKYSPPSTCAPFIPPR